MLCVSVSFRYAEEDHCCVTCSNEPTNLELYECLFIGLLVNYLMHQKKGQLARVFLR
jgi:hypothetical protein